MTVGGGVLVLEVAMIRFHVIYLYRVWGYVGVM